MRYLIYGLAMAGAVVFTWALIRMFGFFRGDGGQTGRWRVLGNDPPLSSNGSGPVFQIHLHADTDLKALVSVGQPLARGWGQRVLLTHAVSVPHQTSLAQASSQDVQQRAPESFARLQRARHHLEEHGIAVETRTILTHEPARVQRYLQHREEARILLIGWMDRWDRSPGRARSLIGNLASAPRKPLLWLRGSYTPEHQVWMYNPRECGLGTAGPIGSALQRHGSADLSICARPRRHESRTEALDQLLSWADRYDLNATDFTTGRDDELVGTILTRATEQDVLVLPESSASLLQRLTVGAVEETLLQEFPGAVLMVEAGETLEAFPAEIDATATG